MIASENHSRRVETSILNDVIMDAVAMNPTPTDKGKTLKSLLYYTSCCKATDICCFCQ